MQLKTMGPQAVLIELEEKIDPEIHNLISVYFQHFQQFLGTEICNLTPAYHSLLIQTQGNVVAHTFVKSQIQQLESLVKAVDPSHRVHKIPVCYEDEFAPDLKLAAHTLNLSKAEIIRLHTSVEYRVYLLGFLPGFPYMGTLAEELNLNRLASPRSKVPKGSVAITGRQTGIYPCESPGGWHLIGQCPLSLFTSSPSIKSLLNPGDGVQFIPISKKQHLSLQKGDSSWK